MKPIRVVVFIATLLITLGVLFYTDGKDHYTRGENASFDLKEGDTFVIKLDENPSTGGKNCWLTDVKSVRLISQDFNPKSSADGAGGVTTYTFKAIAKGVDTLKVANCRLAGEKDCSDYTDDNTKPDNVFVVKVGE
ncbi:protease inhibitor I42 family protein [Flavobacterium sp. MFBS3-15]|uniref:protease inhibitor I42 family protein n=1 Tax=Flavobacterium sp. MFBS3-15 TaxID=2989816 RepID=UPI00223569E7|nr:protease inhibitor I42 family protein [Flavobacterium sp. MFBS3-15]MCW4469060.1 protease inhibitor I42 family protein [Flavobacterium sp. MFBS3-15]